MTKMEFRFILKIEVLYVCIFKRESKEQVSISCSNVDPLGLQCRCLHPV